MPLGGIAPHVGSSPEAVEAARMKLANVLLGLAQNGVQVAKVLTDAAIEAMFVDPTQLRPRL